MSSATSKRSELVWLSTSAGAIILGAFWLRTWSEPYLIAATAAIVLSGLAGVWRHSRVGRIASLAVLPLFLFDGWRSQRSFDEIGAGWTAFEQRSVANGSAELKTMVERDFSALQSAANRALEIPGEQSVRFKALQGMLPPTDDGEVSAVVLENGSPLAWAGPVRVAVDSLTNPTGIVWAEFYTVSYATASLGPRRAVVMRTLASRAPADRLAPSLATITAERVGVRRFELSSAASEGSAPAGISEAPDLWLRAVPFGPGEIRLRIEERARVRGVLALAIAFLSLLLVAWRRPAPTWGRFGSLGVGMALLAKLPLNALSNRSSLFDASYFFAPSGGPLSSSVGTLALASALAILALFALRRVRVPAPSRLVATLVVLAVASLGPFVMRDLARGISLPSRGVPATLWMSWEVALFLAAAALLLTGAGAGRVALRGARGLPPIVAPALAALASLVAPVLWQAPGHWPGWYPVPWIVAMAALALSRRSRAFVLQVSFVAACGSVTVVWGAVARARVRLAERDVAGLRTPDAEMQVLLSRLVIDVEGKPVPRSRTDLLRLYVASDLAASGNPMELATWRVGADEPDAELMVADFEQGPEGEREVVAEVAALGKPILRSAASSQGVQLVLGVPMDTEHVVTVVVSPRTRLIAEDPFSVLLGLEAPSIVEPPYLLAVASLSADAGLAATPRWERTGDEVHGDWRIGGERGFVRAHVEVELRSLDALVQRGALLVLLDLVVLVGLWTLAAADGALWRWVRSRVRRWQASYRARLTLALFGAFVVPAAAFAIWTYRRLQEEDRLSRELLVSETLRAVAATSDLGRLREESDRLDTPLFVYTGGRLTRSSDELYDALAPLGRYLDPTAALSVALGDEVVANRRLAVGGIATLVGYRVLIDTRSERIVLAAPARRSELTLERQHRDLGVLVAFATALGALAALWLSGLAARGFERPIGALRAAALDVAGGQRTLGSLGSVPPYEFRPVYAAFRHMANDLGASRDALELAKQRTEAVLRNVASGVVACDAEGWVTLANAQAERILGAPLATGDSLEVIGVPIIQQRVAAFARSAAIDEGFDLNLHGRQLAARLTRLVHGGGGVVLTVEDVTELARAQRVFAWGEMARQIAHEIKNPLTPIRLGVQHLRRARADGRQDFDQILERNVERILAEIDRLDEIARSFSKFGTAPGQQPPGVATDVTAVMSDVMALERLGESDVEWVMDDSPSGVLAVARADELREVLLNVMENARHARALLVRARVVRESDNVVLLVEDDGDGISPEALPRVFEPHFSTRTSGSGLGLAISKRLVESWGGSIQILPRTPRGTIVRLTLVPAPTP